jgi:hypothetical protein
MRLAGDTQHLDAGIGVDEPDLAGPVELQRGRTDDEEHPGGGRFPQRDDGLPGLAQAHVVAEDRPPAPYKELDTGRLMRIERETRKVHDRLLS